MPLNIYLLLSPGPCLSDSIPVSLTHTSMRMHAGIRKHPETALIELGTYKSSQHFVLSLGAELSQSLKEASRLEGSRPKGCWETGPTLALGN